MSPHRTGERLGSYELVSPIGAGGMGEVWKARDTRVDRIVAIKFHGDTYDVIRVSSDGTPGHRVLMTLRTTELPWFIEAAADGSLYLDQVGRPNSILRASLNGSATELFPVGDFTGSPALPLADGRIVVERHGGKSRVVGLTGSLWRYRREGTSGQPE